MSSFITYRRAQHLDKKHTIFGKVVGGLEILDVLERLEGDQSNRPLRDIIMNDIVIFVDPFEEFWQQRRDKDKTERLAELAKNVPTEDDLQTWTGRNLSIGQQKELDINGGSQGVGKYLGQPEIGNGTAEDDIPQEPVKKKVRTGGFGDFSGW